MEETFTLLPIHLDPATKALSAPTLSDPALNEELEAINKLHRSLLSSDTPNNAPPPPVPVNPKRSGQITKLRETGNTHFRKGQYTDAIKLYSLGLEMALGRPMWEPTGLVREETAMLYANRAAVYIAMQQWPDAAKDAECSVECKKVQNVKAWYRRGQALLEMKRLDEALEWVNSGLEVEANEADLIKLRSEIEAALKVQSRQN
jgi:translocation protein SEC72